MEKIIAAVDTDSYRHLKSEYKLNLQDTHLDYVLSYELKEEGFDDHTVGRHEGFMLRDNVSGVSIDWNQEYLLYTLTINSRDGTYVSFNFGANRFDDASKLKEEIKEWRLIK